MYNAYNYLSKLYGRYFGNKKCKVCDKRFDSESDVCSESCFFADIARKYNEQKIENQLLVERNNQVLNKENEFHRD